MNIDLDVKCKVSGKEYKRYLFSGDSQNGVIGAIGEKILKININITNNKKDIDDAIKALKLYRMML